MNGNGRYLDYLDDRSWLEIVGGVLNSEPAEILSRRSKELLSGAGVGTQVLRVTGTAATTAKGPVDWALIVKFLTLDKLAFQSTSADPCSWDYWKREWWVYRSAWQQELPGPLVAPRCFGTGEIAAGDGSQELAWIAMEDVATETQPAWPQKRFREVARHLGVFNGQYLCGQPIPSEPWLSRDWLRGWTEVSEPLVSQLPVAAAHPVAGRIFTADINEDLLWLWDHRQKLYSTLDQLPKALCHNDAFPRNLYVRGAPSPVSVAIDWAYCGPAPVGQELSALVGATQVFRESRPNRWDDLERDCVGCYTAGLRDTGWSAGDEAFTGYLLSLVLRFAAASLPPLFSLTMTTEHVGLISRLFGCSFDEFVEHSVAVMTFLQHRIHQTKALLGL
jgi:Phosphotransferase enzyme family